MRAALPDEFKHDVLRARREAAKAERDAFQPLLDDVFTFVLPFRRSTRKGAAGESRVDQVFDHTAIDAAMRFAGKLQQDFWPAGQDNFSLEPGPVLAGEANKEQREGLTKQLAAIRDVAQVFFDGQWDLAFHEAALDLVAGTAAILMNPAPMDDDRLWVPISVSIEDIMLEGGADNRVSGIFYTREMTARQILEAWPKGNYQPDLRQKLDPAKTTKFTVETDTLWDPKKRVWRMIVTINGQDAPIDHTQSKTCPWLTPRYFRVPGETYGRGTAMIAMPTIKTANTTARLYLAAASIAMGGIYTAVDDGVFNPDLATFEPFSVWKVARNGGALGPSINRFPDPRLDLQGLVVRDMQMAVKATMMDQALPTDGAAVRSATEIIERVKRLAADHLGAFGRLTEEVTVPAVRRVIELAWKRGLLPQDIEIDRLLVRMRVKSPIALAREAERIQRIMQWLEMVVMTAAQLQQLGMVQHLAKVEDILLSAARSMGVPEELIVSHQEREQMKADEAAQQEAAMAAAAMAAGAGGAPAGAANPMMEMLG